MRTKIKTAHEESYTNGDKTLGVLVNYNIEEFDYIKYYSDTVNISNTDNLVDDNNDKSILNPFVKESFVYIYKEGMYIFFDTIVDMINYLLYGDSKMKRAYMEENEFDKFWDADYIEGKFSDKLKWLN